MRMSIRGLARLVPLALLLLLLIPSAAHAQWTAVAAPGAFLDTCVLLTDGRAMCHVYNTNRWRVLTPDINGNYATGTWADTANMPNGVDASIPACSGAGGCIFAPTYYASQVLPDGRVVVVGGEYLAVTGNNPVWTNIGFMYDPVANTWSAQLTVPFAGGCVGDASSIVLENGTMILADGTDCTTNGNLASFNPATLTFTALNPTGKADRNNEENWTILPDGRILTIDARVVAQSEIYDPVTNTWGNRANTVVNMADFGAGVGNSSEIGPAVLRPDGTAIGFSGNSLGQNAVYDVATNTWSNTAAMNFGDSAPAGDGTDAVADGTASLLPNGNVLVMASPVLNNDTFNPPASFYEWDGTTLTQVADSPNAASFNAYQGRMLLLPTGHVLLTAHNQNATSGRPAVPQRRRAAECVAARDHLRTQHGGGGQHLPDHRQAVQRLLGGRVPTVTTRNRPRTIRWSASATRGPDMSSTSALMTTARWGWTRSEAWRPPRRSSTCRLASKRVRASWSW